MPTAAQVSKALNAKGLKGSCPMCSQNNWSGIDGYLNQSVSKDATSLQIGGTTIPVVAIACGNCGFLSMHAAKVVGLA